MAVIGFKLSATTTAGLEVVSTQTSERGDVVDSKTLPISVLNETSGEDAGMAPAICGFRKKKGNCYYVTDWEDLEMRTSESGVEVWGAKHEKSDIGSGSAYDRKGELEVIAKISGTEIVRSSSRKVLPEVFRTEAERQQVLRVFQRLAQDGSGIIERGDLVSFLQEIEPGYWKEAVVSDLLDDMDTNKDQKVDFDELLRYFFSPSRFCEKLAKMAKDFDKALLGGNIMVTVTRMGGTVAFGPAELQATTTADELKKKACLKGRLLSSSGGILKNQDPLGYHCPCLSHEEDRTLQLTLVVSVFDDIAEECVTQLNDLKAFRTFDGNPCIRVHNSHSFPDHHTQEWNSYEFMLTNTGHIMAKRYYSYDDDDGSYQRWDIAEGIYSVEDSATCTINVTWQAHAQKTKSMDYNEGSVHEKEWEAIEIREVYQPSGIIPNFSGQTKVLQMAQMGEQVKMHYKGVILHGLSDDVIKSLGMEPTHLSYWNYCGELDAD